MPPGSSDVEGLDDILVEANARMRTLGVVRKADK